MAQQISAMTHWIEIWGKLVALISVEALIKL
jgi:hypothetical protein